LVTLVHAMGTAAATRMPLELTLAVLSEDNEDPQLAAIARKLNARLQRGATVDQAVGELDAELPTEVRGLVRAGIESGDLAGSFERFTRERLASQQIRRRIRAAIAYPIVILTMWTGILLFLSLYVIPMFDEMYRDLEMELPAATTLVLQTSKQLPGLIVGLLLVMLAVPIALRIFGGRWLFHRFRAAVPLFGRLWMWLGQREFAAVLASFVDHRLPLPRAVQYRVLSISDRNVARACARVAERLDEGQSLGDSMGHSISFDRSLTAIANWGEKQNLLSDSLRIASDVFDDRIEQQLALVRRLVAPLSLIGIGTMAIFVVIGLFIPIVRLIQSLSM
jgi:type II secretory pathway component PulF